MRKISKWRLLLLIAVIHVAGCSDHSETITTASPSPLSPPTASVSLAPSAQPITTTLPQSVEVPPDSKVKIMLKEEPRMPSNASALVSVLPQHWTLEFSDSMNRASVEDTLKRNLLPMGIDQSPVELTFAWVNDRLLQVVTSPIQTNDLKDHRIIYNLSANDALTSSGVQLKDTDVFRAIVGQVQQIYRISLDGKVKEQLSSFDKPYMFNRVPNDPGYIFAAQSTYYCECDASSKVIYDLFDYEQRSLVPYPVELFYSYTGDGTFFADKKGFFYANPQGLKVPDSSTDYKMSFDKHVFGSGISRDRRYAIVALGDKDQKTDFDLVLLNFETGKQEIYAKAMKGYAPENQVSSGTMPIFFHDDGKHVSFTMENKDPWGFTLQAFNWETHKVEPWSLPTGDQWVNSEMTSDGVYQLYSNGDLYKKGVKQSKPQRISNGSWINDTHQLLVPEWLTDNKSQLIVYDPDNGTINDTHIVLEPGEHFIGTSSDGKWIFVAGK